jgi:hypothetical protein
LCARDLSPSYFPGSPRQFSFYFPHSLGQAAIKLTARERERAAKRADEMNPRELSLSLSAPTERDIFANDDRASINLSALGAAYCFCHYKVERSKKIMNAATAAALSRDFLGRVHHHLIRSFSTQSAKMIITRTRLACGQLLLI